MNINEIASEAGVSIATVSRVLNGKSDVSDETRRKILYIIRQKGFKPKVAVTSVVDNIGVFISNNYTILSNPYSSLVISGIASVLFNNDLSITLIPCAKIPRDGVDFLNFCVQRRISGGIFISSNLDDIYIKELGKYVPVVLAGNDLNCEYIGSVRSNNFNGAYEAVKYLIKLGHKDILLIMADLHYVDHRDRYEGAKKAIEEYGMQLSEYNIMDSYVLNDADLAYKLKFIFDNSKIDGIFVGGDQEAIRVVKALQGNGIEIPNNVSVIGYDNLEIACHTNPPLTTVNQPIFEIGQKCAKMLMNMVKDRGFKPKREIIENNQLMIRESTSYR